MSTLLPREQLVDYEVGDREVDALCSTNVDREATRGLCDPQVPFKVAQWPQRAPCLNSSSEGHLLPRQKRQRQDPYAAFCADCSAYWLHPVHSAFQSAPR